MKVDLSQVAAKVRQWLPSVEKAESVAEGLAIAGPKIFEDITRDIAAVEAALHNPAALPAAFEDLKETVADIEKAWPYITGAVVANTPAEPAAGSGA